MHRVGVLEVQLPESVLDKPLAPFEVCPRSKLFVSPGLLDKLSYLSLSLWFHGHLLVLLYLTQFLLEVESIQAKHLSYVLLGIHVSSDWATVCTRNPQALRISALSSILMGFDF